MTLTDLQIQHYDTFGFLLIPAFLDEGTVETLRHRLDEMKAEESGEPDTLKHRGRVHGMFHKDPVQLALFDDPRLYAIATQLLRVNGTLRFLGDEYASFSTPADWHPDCPQWMSWQSLKFGFYLDDVSQGGYLRVIPGSHHKELSDSIEAYRTASQPAPPVEVAHDCVTQPGDLLIFNLKIWHEGTANPDGTHRRVIFWSVGQDTPEFNEAACGMHNHMGRGESDSPWPELILKDAPPHRIEMLGVHKPETPKHRSLTEISGSTS